MKRIDNYISNEKISSLDEYIIEKLKIGKSTKTQYTCHPKDKYELREILAERLGNDKDANLNDIDVSKIKDMGIFNSKGLFEGLDPHNIDISDWNVSKVENMNCMFYGCQNLDCDLGGWDVSSVEDMYMMFAHCKTFKGDGLNYWKVSKVEDTHMMFYECENFNCDLSGWDVSNIKFTKKMFRGCNSLKNIPSWYR